MQNQSLNETCTLIVPPNIQSAICGVRLARIFASGKVELEYVDGTKASAKLTAEDLNEGRLNFFRLVSIVQSKSE